MKGHNSAGMNRKSVQAEPLLGHFSTALNAVRSFVYRGIATAEFQKWENFSRRLQNLSQA
jgi:hypothetical protein